MSRHISVNQNCVRTLKQKIPACKNHYYLIKIQRKHVLVEKSIGVWKSMHNCTNKCGMKLNFCKSYILKLRFQYRYVKSYN